MSWDVVAKVNPIRQYNKATMSHQFEAPVYHDAKGHPFVKADELTKGDIEKIQGYLKAKEDRPKRPTVRR